MGPVPCDAEVYRGHCQMGMVFTEVGVYFHWNLALPNFIVQRLLSSVSNMTGEY
jgi:hypothetical protein